MKDETLIIWTFFFHLYKQLAFVLYKGRDPSSARHGQLAGLLSGIGLPCPTRPIR